MSFSKVDILGVQFSDVPMCEMMKHLEGHLLNEEKTFVVTANPEIVMYAQKNKRYKDMINQATYVTPDGMGIVKASQILKRPIRERVTGFDIFVSLLKVADERNLRVYLLGAENAVLEKTRSAINDMFSDLQIVGSHHGYFDWNDHYVVEEIKEKQPDLIFVAMGFPRQEDWISQHISQFNKGVFIGVGGSFDVLSGVAKRAPKIWQNLSVEWLYRLLQQPARGRRMVALPMFALEIFRQKVKGIK